VRERKGEETIMSRATNIITAVPDNNSSDSEESADGESSSVGFYGDYHFPSFGTIPSRKSPDDATDDDHCDGDTMVKTIDGHVKSNPSMVGCEELTGSAAVQVDTNRLERYLQSIKERLKYHEELIHDLSREWKEGSKDHIQKTAGIVRKVDYCSMEVNSLRDYILTDHQQKSSKGSSYGSSSNSNNNTATLSVLRSGTDLTYYLRVVDDKHCTHSPNFCHLPITSCRHREPASGCPPHRAVSE